MRVRHFNYEPRTTTDTECWAFCGRLPCPEVAYFPEDENDRYLNDCFFFLHILCVRIINATGL